MVWFLALAVSDGQIISSETYRLFAFALLQFPKEPHLYIANNSKQNLFFSFLNELRTLYIKFYFESLSYPRLLELTWPIACTFEIFHLAAFLKPEILRVQISESPFCCFSFHDPFSLKQFSVSSESFADTQNLLSTDQLSHRFSNSFRFLLFQQNHYTESDSSVLRIPVENFLLRKTETKLQPILYNSICLLPIFFGKTR